MRGFWGIDRVRQRRVPFAYERVSKQALSGWTERGTNGRQPLRSGRIRTSFASASRGSRWSSASHHVNPMKIFCLFGLSLGFVTGESAGLQAQPAKPAQPAPSVVDLRPNFVRWNLPLRKQGGRNTCSVLTTVGAMDYALAKRLDRGVALSAEYLNWACNQVINNQSADRGQFFHDLLNGYERYGICADADMPYARKFTPRYQPTAQATNRAAANRAYGLRANWIKRNDGKVGVSDKEIEEAKATLRKGWPVCAGSFHSVLFVGYKDAPSLEGGGGFFFRDSGDGKQEIMTYKEAKGRLCDLLWFDIQSPKSR